MSDELLVGVMQALNKKGIRIPEEVAVIAISDGNVPNFYFPPITYVAHSGGQVGQSAVSLLFDLIENPKKESPAKIVLSTHLIRTGIYIAVGD